MDDSKRHVVQFLEKEIKTYKALARFLAKKGIEEHVRIGSKRILIAPRSIRTGWTRRENL